MLIDILGTSICPLRTNLTVQNVEQASQTIKYYVIKKKKQQQYKMSSYTSKVTGKQYKIFCTVNCKSANIIYILECSVCGLQYVGESKQPFHKRLNGHRSDLTKKPFLPVSQHFGLSDHGLEDFNRMKILVIEQNCLWSDFQRENRERFWIKELRVLHPDGINRKQ